MNIKTWAIIGGGNGGQTMAGHLALLNQKVRLYKRSKTGVDKINKTKNIILHHSIEGIGHIEFATDNIREAVDGADVIMIILPSTVHEQIAKEMIPHLCDGQVVLIHPEESCGAIQFRKIMKDLGCSKDIVVGATSTLLYSTRIINDGEVYVHGTKGTVPMAALPATDNDRLKKAICDVLPMFVLYNNVLEISIDNLNALMHSGPILLNTSRIEANPFIPYQYYIEGITPSIALFIEAMDKERIAVAKELGIDQRCLRDEYIDMYKYGTKDMSLYEIVSSNPGYKDLMISDTIHNRYVIEDIPFSLVPLCALGDLVGVDTPCMDAVCTIGKAILGDELVEGRTLNNLGLIETNKEELLLYINGE